MNLIINQFKMVLFLALVLSGQAHALPETIECKVIETNDLLEIEKNRMIFQSDTFEVFQMIDGMTLMVINKQTNKFNRIVNLNLLEHSSLGKNRPPEPLQVLTGHCR